MKIPLRTPNGLRSPGRHGRGALRRIAGSLGILVLSGLCVGAIVHASQPASIQLTILHSSEHHGALVPQVRDGKEAGGMARRATIVADIRREGRPVLLVDSGDILIGTALSSWFRGKPDIEAMNVMGYHAMAAGNHDFDYGLTHLRKLQQLAAFPILCSNLRLRVTMDSLPCERMAVVRLDGVAIGLIGLVGRSNFPDTFNREVVKTLTLEDPVATARRYAQRLKAGQHVDLVVAITHQDTEEDLALLAQDTGVDVIVGGHTEGFDGLYVPGAAVPREEAKNPVRVYVKTHRQGQTVGRLDLLIRHGRIARARAKNIPVSAAVPEDLAVNSLVDDYVRVFAAEASRVVGRVQEDLHGDRLLVRTRETNLGNVLADLIRTEFGTDVALINGGQIRGSFPAGDITLGDVLAVLPFDSPLVTLHVTGRQLRAALENSVSQLPRASGRFLQVSGLTVVYDLHAPHGHRVRDVTVQGRPLNDDAVYTVVTDAFLAEGGDGYAMFAQAAKRLDHQTPMRDVLLRALANGPLSGRVEGRIRFAHGPAAWTPALPFR
ncbi:MAG: bifunctional metallophosphatase/5'-nucleotidase [Nitrospirae bacterium]|nr:MAG: bifunctional metallophosphatase/5'-nucleotidase [Nitrospirota bacterium]